MSLISVLGIRAIQGLFCQPDLASTVAGLPPSPDFVTGPIAYVQTGIGP
jgi:hypothetical protein